MVFGRSGSSRNGFGGADVENKGLLEGIWFWRLRTGAPLRVSAATIRKRYAVLHMKPQLYSGQFTRREAIGLFGAAASAFAANAPQFPKGAIIRTVLKDLPPTALAGGTTLFHEHLSLAPDFLPKWTALFRAMSGQSAQTKAGPPPAPPSDQPYFLEDLDLLTTELRAAASDGISCIVDAGHPDMGRNLDFLKQLSMRSGMPIVAGFGYYAQPFYPPEIATMSEDRIAEELVRQANTQPLGALG